MTTSVPVPVVLVHGLWLHASSWDNWMTLLQERGYQPVAPGWPGDSATPEQTRENPESAANHGKEIHSGHFLDIFFLQTVQPQGCGTAGMGCIPR